ncbi:helix-turn-helix domain-containing protein, partial [Pelagibacteraceae bacterium]|nr:helix-turn-helix domain-containing protein [Pelagibacteraceae bacterium]
NEKLTNINNNSFCYLTKLESEILTYLIVEKESTKKHIQENILNIKSTIQTNSLDSHLTRIRKKMYKIKTSVKIQSKSEKLLIVI